MKNMKNKRLEKKPVYPMRAAILVYKHKLPPQLFDKAHRYGLAAGISPEIVTLVAKTESVEELLTLLMKAGALYKRRPALG
jgi:hypothetical protein